MMLDDRGSADRTGWDASQRAVLAAAEVEQALVVTGAPGTGKSSIAVEVVARAVSGGGVDPRRVLLLAPSRRSADRLRETLAARRSMATLGVTARSVAAAAFDVIRHGCQVRGTPPPTLVTGPQQDTVLQSLLAGHAAGEGVALPWPESISREMLAMRGFRDELRDLFMRCAERGIDPDELAELGREQHRPEWAAAARLLDEYLDVTALAGMTPDSGPRYDAASLVHEAASTLRAWQEDDEPGRLQRDLVVVDDYQEATTATAALLDAMARDGARLVLLGDPDTAVQGFRGARPGLLERATAPASAGQPHQWGARALTLGTAWRQVPTLRAVTAAIADQVSVTAGAKHRQAVAAPAPVLADAVTDSARPTEGASVHVLASSGQEHARVARVLREERIRHQTPWREMAVIARSNAQVGELRRVLLAAGVPVRSVRTATPLRDEPAARGLLTAARAAGATTLDEASVVELLTSPYGGVDASGMRRIRRALLAAHAATDGRASSTELLVDMLTELAAAAAASDPASDSGPAKPGAGGLLTALDSDQRVGVQRVAGILAAARAAVRARSDPHRGLWALWHAAGLGEQWRQSALRGGTAGERADHDLDVVLALLREAEFVSERSGGVSFAQFCERLLGQDIASDSLGARADDEEAVSVISVADAAGLGWQVVVVAGVQDGVWPDLRIRDSFLGSHVLADLVDGRAVGDATIPDHRAQRRAVLDDELRMFTVAASRACRRLIVTAVRDGDMVPSVFCSLVQPGSADVEPSVERAALAPLDLRGLVGQARERLVEALEPVNGESRRGVGWARLLAQLSQEGVHEAHPDRWWGVAEPSSTDPLVAPGQRVKVSPSKVALAHSCALRWAMESVGGTDGSTTAAGLGTLVHSIASEYPTAGAPELLQVLAERWHELGLKPGWPSLQMRSNAEAMVRRLAEFQSNRAAPLAVEKEFDVVVGRTRLRGSIDRVDAAAKEGNGPAGVRITDYKTGSSVLSARQAEVDPQLVSYQLAVDRGALDHPVAGAGMTGLDEEQTHMAIEARLVYLGYASVNVKTREQRALRDFPEPSWGEQMVEQAGEIMAAGQFWATINDGCRMCPVRRMCPVQPEGERLVLPRPIATDRGVVRAPVSSFSSLEDREGRAFGSDGITQNLENRG